MGRAERGYMGEATYKTWIQNYLFVQFRRDWAPPANLFPCPEGALEPPAHWGVQKGGSGEASDTVRSLARSSFQVSLLSLSVLSTPWEQKPGTHRMGFSGTLTSLGSQKHCPPGWKQAGSGPCCALGPLAAGLGPQEEGGLRGSGSGVGSSGVHVGPGQAAQVAGLECTLHRPEHDAEEQQQQGRNESQASPVPTAVPAAGQAAPAADRLRVGYRYRELGGLGQAHVHT